MGIAFHYTDLRRSCQQGLGHVLASLRRAARHLTPSTCEAAATTTLTDAPHQAVPTAPSARARNTDTCRHIVRSSSGLLASLPQCPAPSRERPAAKVRILRSASGVERLVISGRMADVCAELDRLVARESLA